MQTENTYVETDLGNIALNPRGEYSDEVSYEYLDTVSYEGGSYICVAELGKSISGIAPAQGKNTEHWQMLTLPGQLTPGAIAMHDDIVNKSKQVETSRAAVELSQQAVEDAQVDVRQMRQDTQEASESAIASRDAAAGYAQAAEASRTAAAESEQNINAQVNNFNTHVSEKTSAAEASIEEARKKAINAVTTQQDLSIKAVTDEETRQTNAAIKAVTTQQNNSVQAIADEASEQIKKIKDSLDKGLSEEGKAADAKATGEAISNLTEDLSNKITKFYASNQGETHLSDSDNGKIMDMMLYGKSSQFTTTGKNLANGQNINCFINSAADTVGISINDIGMVIDASKLTNVSISTRSIQDRYRFACADTVPTRGNPITCYNGAVKDGTKDSYTIDTTGYNYLFINATKLEDIQVEKGSKSTSYEPYTGGIPSPNPSYPQEIKSVVNPIVKLSNEDGTQSETVTLPYTLNAVPVSSGGNVTINGQQYVADYVDIEKGKLYRKVKRLNLKDVDDARITYGSHSNRNGYLSFSVGGANKEQQPISNRYKGSVWTSESGYAYIPSGESFVIVDDRFTDKQTAIKLIQDTYVIYALSSQTEEDLSLEQIKSLKSLSTNYPVTNITVSSEELDGYAVFNYPVSMANGWNYVKQQLNDNRDYIYDMDLQSAEAYVNSEYAVALTELEV